MLASQETITPAEEKTNAVVVNEVSLGAVTVIVGHIPSDSSLQIGDSISHKSSLILVICATYMVYGSSNSGQTVFDCSLVDRFPNCTATNVC